MAINLIRSERFSNRNDELTDLGPSSYNVSIKSINKQTNQLNAPFGSLVSRKLQSETKDNVKYFYTIFLLKKYKQTTIDTDENSSYNNILDKNHSFFLSDTDRFYKRNLKVPGPGYYPINGMSQIIISDIEKTEKLLEKSKSKRDFRAYPHPDRLFKENELVSRQFSIKPLDEDKISVSDQRKTATSLGISKTGNNWFKK